MKVQGRKSLSPVFTKGKGHHANCVMLCKTVKEYHLSPGIDHPIMAARSTANGYPPLEPFG
jgi:hypothetical protein